MLNQYGSLDEIVAHASEISGVVGENLRSTLEWLPQGKRLLTVKTDCDLPVAPVDLKPALPDAAQLKALYERFEFKSWQRDVPDAGSSAEIKSRRLRRHRPQADECHPSRHFEFFIQHMLPGKRMI